MIIWKPLVSECLQFVKKLAKEVNKNAVAVVCINSHCKKRVIGHTQQNISVIVYMFLSLPHCALGIFATRKRVNHQGDYRLEIPEKTIKPNNK